MGVRVSCCGFPVPQARYFRPFPDLCCLAAFCHGQGTTYVLFNNDSMWEDAQRFTRLLRGRRARR